VSARPDLGALFDEHVASEFEAKDIEATMRTMAPDPYVWHVPTLAGASGYDEVRRFYSTRFIGQTPDDAEMVSIARTISHDRVIDESVLEFTHDIEIPFMLPGVEPTRRRARVPTVVVMDFEGDKVASERIYWDQATLLIQLGLLDIGALPAAGIEQAERLLGLAG
jgi:carboxymethylenebutenolidase